MRVCKIGKEELFKSNIRRLSKLDEKTRQEIKAEAQSLAAETDFTEDVALKMALDRLDHNQMT